MSSSLCRYGIGATVLSCVLGAAVSAVPLAYDVRVSESDVHVDLTAQGAIDVTPDFTELLPGDSTKTRIALGIEQGALQDQSLNLPPINEDVDIGDLGLVTGGSSSGNSRWPTSRRRSSTRTSCRSPSRTPRSCSASDSSHSGSCGAVSRRAALRA